MANQRHKDKRIVGFQIFKWDKADLKEIAKIHGVSMSDVFKASTAHFLGLKKVKQEKILNAADWK
tara:strand:- start:651 stop:845 length:195 start_codon:yes stop_codon:yes gene_type:complete